LERGNNLRGLELTDISRRFPNSDCRSQSHSVAIVTEVPWCTGLNLATDFAGSVELWNNYQEINPGDKTLCVPAGTYYRNAHENIFPVISAFGPGTQITVGQDRETTFFDEFGDAVNHEIYRNPPPVGNNTINYPLAKIDTMLVGESVATLKDLARASDFSVGQWVLLIAYDMQGYGYPQNNHFFEYRQIAAINVGTGEITLDQGVRHDYKDTYPHLNDGTALQPDPGGDATIIPLYTAGWDAHYILRNLTINPVATNAIYGSARKITWEHCIFPNYGHIPTGTKDITYRNCSFLNGIGFEFDKFVDTVTFEDCTGEFESLGVQSSSIYELTMNNCDFLTLSGTPKYVTITDSNFTNLKFSPFAYGAGSYEVVLDNVTVSNLSPNFSGFDISHFTSTAGGVFTIPVATAVAAGVDVILRFIPDPLSWYCFAYGGGVGRAGPSFQVTDVTEAGGILSYTTTLTGSEPELALATRIVSIDCTELTVINTTEGALAPMSYPAAAGLAAGEYFNTGPWNPSNFYWMSGGVPRIAGLPTSQEGWLAGTLVSLTFTVTKPYTGTQSTLAIAIQGGEFFGSRWKKSDASIDSFGGPYFDLKFAGTRVITPSGVTGSQGTESNDLWAAGFRWWVSGNRFAYRVEHDITGEDPSVYPEFEFELILDQGIT
jgi:hypothetical protein